VKIARAAMEAVKAHGAEGYPHEICGLLVGYPDRGLITEIHKLRNIDEDRPHDRYTIDSYEDMRARKKIYSRGLDVVGYYHSHPDHPARPSPFDTDRSWATYVYLIVSVVRGSAVDANVFIAENDKGPFRSEPLEVV